MLTRNSGWTTSAKLRQVLVTYVARELRRAFESPSFKSASPAATPQSSALPSPETIDAAIKLGFTKLDHDIVHASVAAASSARSKRAAVELLAPAFSGACALLSFYDTRTQLLRVS